MAFNFFCSKCGSMLQAQDDWENLETTCPQCGNPIRILRRDAAPGGPASFRTATGRALNGSGRLIHRRGLDRLFFWWWAPLAAFLPVCVLVVVGAGMLSGMLYASGTASAVAFLLLTGVAWLVGCSMYVVSEVMWYILLYRYWQLIPAARAATTPGKAVGFMFIPVFKLYWMFVAIAGLGFALDREFGRKGAGVVALCYCLVYLVQCFFAWGLFFSSQGLMNVMLFLISNGLFVVYFLLCIIFTVMFQRTARRLLACYEGAGF